MQAEIQRVLVCGGREFNDRDYVFQQLERLHSRHRFRLLIHGGAGGADSIADAWARGSGVQPVTCEPLWYYYRAKGLVRAAGVLRNQAMLLLHPQLVIAFPGGRGTADMINRATLAGVPVLNLAKDYPAENPD